MTKHRSEPKTGAGALTQGFLDEKEGISPPEGVDLDTPESWVLWRQYTSIRASSDWRPSDLLMLGKVVQWELEIRELTRLIGIEGHMIDERENKRVAIRTNMMAQLIRMSTTLSLNNLGKDARTVNKAGQEKAKRGSGTLLEKASGWG